MLKGTKQDRDGLVDGFIQIEYQGYPMLQRGNGAISGEVYRVPDSCWHDFDDWEEVPEVYQRTSVTLLDGRSVWLYEAAPRINQSKK